ncbi:MAG: hypothetical protein HY819_02385 [Acidobacteria bacterium]|nr:hypothetical protein [Acidobacteriota bacterium]
MTSLEAADFCGNFKAIGPIVIAIIAITIGLLFKNQVTNLEKLFNKIAYKKTLGLILVGVLAFLGSATISLLFSWPIPVIHDEFSYLLAADTFSRGRLTNPAHPMWVHFETIFVLSQPTYNSQYPPGQGLALALGQVLTGYPIVGVWFSMARVAVCWMLQAWVPARWAFLGALLMVLKLGLFSYWSQSYWGGAVATIGGSLLFGALRQIVKQPKKSNALLLGLGLAILANTRPYEGLILSLPASGFLIFWLISKKSPPFKQTLKEIILPLSILLFIVTLMMGYYNWRITGNPLLMPYQASQDIYNNLTTFIWTKPKNKIINYNHEEIRFVYEDIIGSFYRSNQGLENFVNFSLLKLSNLFSFFLDMPFTLIIFVLPFLARNSWVRFALLSYFVLVIGMLQVIWSYPHYAAPGTCLIYFLIVQSLRKIYSWRLRKYFIGKFIVCSIPIYCICLIILPIALKLDPFMYVNPSFWELPRTSFPSWSIKREKIISQLKREPQQHLVIVKYWPGHNVEAEWVYNEADIDNAKIVWARFMTPEKNCELINYFSNRKVWILEKKIGEEPSLTLYNNCK